MTQPLIAPLRKSNKTNGALYTRFPKITAKLVEMSTWQPDKITACCLVDDVDSPDYVESECLVYLVRERRSDAFDDFSEMLFKTLMTRVLLGLPHAESLDGSSERMTYSNVRDEGRHRFVSMLMEDRQNYLDGLDIFEVRFAMALKKLRIDAQRKVFPKDNPLESIEIDNETGELSPEVEKAVGSFDPFDLSAIDNFDYLLRLDEAINTLPELQKTIVVMIRKEFPIESKEPGVVNISSTLGKTPKTIRAQRDKAYTTLRTVLVKGKIK